MKAHRCTALIIMVLLGAGVSTAHADEGAAVYQAHCAGCHEQAQGRVPTRDALGSMTARAILQALETGAMRVLGTFALNGPQRVAVAEYLGTGSVDSDWAAAPGNRCSAGPPWPRADAFSRPRWPDWGNGPENRRYQPGPMAGVDRGNVGRLTLAWVYAFPGETVVESQPTVLDGRLFIGTRAGAMLALDAHTGCEHWRVPTDAAVKGAVVLGRVGPQGRVIAVAGDIAGQVYAVDAASGQLLWRIAADPDPQARIAGSVQVVADSVLIPLSSLEEGASMDPAYPCCSFRGAVLRVDALTGAVIWRHHTIAEPATQRGHNRAGTPRFGPSGAQVWSAPTVDVNHGIVYIATGDNHSHPATDTSDAVLAVSLASGERLWQFQGVAGDVFNGVCMRGERSNCPDNAGPDHDMAAPAILVPDARGRPWLVAGQKSGVVHWLDPATGERHHQRRVAEGGILGGIEWGMAAADGRLYVPRSDIDWKNDDFLSATTVIDPSRGGGLVAMDLASGKTLWAAPAVSCAGRQRCSPGQPAAATALPEVVFSGSVSGVMRAFDADTGEVLWQYDTVREYQAVNGARARGGAIDGPGVVVVDGWVYMTSGYAKWGGLPGNVLLAFRAGEAAVTP